MATKVTPKAFVEALKEWSVLDVKEALDILESELGIKPAAAMAAAPAAAATAAAEEAPAEEKTKPVLENVSKEDADKAAAKLKEAGATVEIK